MARFKPGLHKDGRSAVTVVQDPGATYYAEKFHRDLDRAARALEKLRLAHETSR